MKERIKHIMLSLGAMVWLLSGSAQILNNKGDTIYIGNGVIVYINGSIQNLDNGSLYPYIQNNGILQLTGDFIKSPGTIYTGQDSFLLSGSATQNVAGLNYWYVAVTGGGTATFTSDASINKSLIVSNGSIYTSGHTITLDSQATLVEDSANYITGKVQMQKYLPQGVNYTFGGMGLEIKADSASPGMTTVTRTTGSHLTGNGYASIDRYFTVTPANNGNTGSTITYHYFDLELNALSESDLALYRHRSNSKWQYDGFTGRNSATNVVTASADSLGIFTLASISYPLPVELMDFEANLLNPESSLLTWQTASEENNDHFDIERSEDGRSFEKIGEVQGHGTTNVLNSYIYKDIFGPVNTDVLYYRLKQVDYNGEFKYSEIRNVMLKSASEKFKVWYNRAINKMEAIVYYNTQTMASFRMIDIQGKLVAEQNVTLNKGTSHIQMDMFGLAEGIYTLYLVDANSLEVKRVMKN